jgi:hypothetical protein
LKRDTENMREVYDIEPLCAAILRRAAKDYIISLKRKDLYAIASLERFFMSDWGQLMSRNQGQHIINLCRELVRTKRGERECR